MGNEIIMESVYWKVCTHNLLKEILNNPGTEVLNIPMTIFADLLMQVSLRASEINDPELNALMCRLALYSIADPYSEDYDSDAVRSILEGKYE